MFSKVCQICNIVFEARVSNKQCCSVECLKAKGKQKSRLCYAQKSRLIRKSAICVTCNRTFDYRFRQDRGERKFCSRSCASKYYISTGVYDVWKHKSLPKRGAELKCLNPLCLNMVYVPPRMLKANKSRTCSFSCEQQYFSLLFAGDKNPMFGKRLSISQKAKQKATLEKNHPGVTNAFQLGKRRTKSKAQIEIFEYLRKKYPSYCFQIEKRVSNANDIELYADIVSFSKKLIIEFNGDYWHCNPRKYNADYFNAKKKAYAKDIWLADKNRLETFESLGYTIVIVWESEFHSNKWAELVCELVEKYAEKNDTDVV